MAMKFKQAPSMKAPKIKVKKSALKKAFKKINKNRHKALVRARGIKRRLEKKGYDLSGLDLESMSTRKLKALNRKKMIQDYATQESIDEVIEAERPIKERKKILRAQKRKLAAIRKKQQEKIISIDEAKEQDEEWNPGNTYQIIPAGSEAKIAVDLIMKQIETGENYKGKRASSEALIQMSAGRLRVIFESARKKYGDEEIVNRIKETFGSMEKCSAVIERLIYAVYDDLLAEWADGISAYDHLISTVVGALGVTDPGF